jgi:hypothetical protein
MMLVPSKPWLFVNVIEQIQELTVDANGFANILISVSFGYVLARSGYDRVIRH